MSYPATRLRRLRSRESIRELVAETRLSASDLILPVFVHEEGRNVAVESMPGVERLSADGLQRTAETALGLGIRAIAIFPVVPSGKKSAPAEEAFNPEGLAAQSVRTVRNRFPELEIVTDVALDPYTTHGHDGLMSEDGTIMNDETIDVLVRQALCLAEAGSHMVAPSDMMDGRIGRIRAALEGDGRRDTLILSYAAKYASAFYGPFRDAVGSGENLGKADKKTYQMDPRNVDEAEREIGFDIEEGADIVMVKPGLPCLDMISLAKRRFRIPVFAYQVSGEYAMIKASAERGWIDGDSAMLETLTALRRAGADCVLTYFALEAARLLR